MKKIDEQKYLNQASLQALYPKFPDGKKEELRSRFTRMKEGEPPQMKRKLTLATALGLLSVMIVVIAIAEATTHIISDYFTQHGFVLGQEAQELLSQNTKPLLTQDMQDITFSIQQVVNDGNGLFVAALAKPKPGKSIVFSAERIPHIEENEGFKTPDELFALAEKSGSTVIDISLKISDQWSWRQSADEITEDGNFQLFYYYDQVDNLEQPDQLSLSFDVSSYSFESTRHLDTQTVQWTGPLAPNILLTKEVAIHQAVDKTEVVLEDLTLRLTPLAMYYSVDFFYPHEAYAKNYAQKGLYMIGNDVLLHFFDAKGNEIRSGFEFNQCEYLYGESHFRQSGSFNLTDFPEQIYIKVYNVSDGSFSKALKVELP